MKITPEIKIRSGKIEGYGAPGYWWLNVTYQNTLLYKGRASSERDLVRKELELEATWRKEWDEAEFLAAIAGKPAASVLCDHCGSHTQDGLTSSVDMIFCNKCSEAGFMEPYKEAYRERVRQSEEKRAAEQIEREAKRIAEVEDAKRGFHWRDGWFFNRIVDGSIRIRKVCSNAVYEDITIPPNEWASIVCSVSKDGESNGRWNVAQDFHGRESKLTSAPHQPDSGEKA